MEKKYTNPVPYLDGGSYTNPDPFVLQWCGRYYCYATDEDGVRVSLSYDLVNWENLGYAIKEEAYHYYWAPSVIYLNGTFYMYYSNIAIEDDDQHNEHLKLATSKNPEGPFVWEKTFFDTFSIDSHPFLWGDKLYMFYSVNDWMGTEEKRAGTCILLDEMITPKEFSGNPRAVVLPSLPQEIYAADRFQDGRDWYTIEGACTFVKHHKIWLMYSANAYEHENYFVGTAVAEERETLLDAVWNKYPNDNTWHPLLKRNDKVEGTGHNTVVKAPDMVEDFIVYHGRNTADELKLGVEQRTMRIDRLLCNGRELVCLGPTMEPTAYPGKPAVCVFDKKVENELLWAEPMDYYHAQWWIAADKIHSGARYGIYLNYEDAQNYLQLRVDSGKKQLQIWSCRQGILAERECARIAGAFDVANAHLLTVQKDIEQYRVWLNGREYFSCQREWEEKSGRIGIRSLYSDITVKSMMLVEHVELEGALLRNILRFYEIHASEYGCTVQMEKDGMAFWGTAVLCRKLMAGTLKAYREEFQICAAGPEAKLVLRTKNGEREEYFCDGSGSEMAVHCIVKEKKSQVFVNGRLISDTVWMDEIEFQNIKMISYEFTKK